MFYHFLHEVGVDRIRKRTAELLEVCLGSAKGGMGRADYYPSDELESCSFSAFIFESVRLRASAPTELLFNFDPRFTFSIEKCSHEVTATSFASPPQTEKALKGKVNLGYDPDYIVAVLDLFDSMTAMVKGQFQNHKFFVDPQKRVFEMIVNHKYVWLSFQS